jgi:hypothetical protein
MLLAKARNYIANFGFSSFLGLLVKNLRYYFRMWLDGRFDKKYQIETVGKVDLSNLTINSLNKLDGIYYEPTPERVFHSIMSGLNIDYEKYDFVDYGSGKGRVILMASRYPFRRIVGVEFGSELAKIADDNIVKFKDPKQRCKKIESLCMDAVEYTIPLSSVVLYFFNPFKSDVMERIVEKINNSYKELPRDIVVVYYHPQSARLFDKLGFLTKIESASRVIDLTSPQFRGFVVYKAIGGAAV